MPSKKILKAMMQANPDGFGYVAETSYYKTLDFDDFIKKLRRVPKAENCIIHFRWATHGSVCTSNCHPFHNADNSIFFAHNGVLPIRSVNDKTDSEIAFTRKILPAIEKYGIMGAWATIEGLRGSSRFAIMDNGEIHLYGSYMSYGGYQFSNLRFLPMTDRRYYLNVI